MSGSPRDDVGERTIERDETRGLPEKSDWENPVKKLFDIHWNTGIFQVA